MARPAPRPANDLEMYDAHAERWWAGDTAWLRTLHNMVPARLRHFDRIVGDWQGLEVLDLGCGGGFMAEAMAEKGAKVTGVDPAAQALAAARRHAERMGLSIDYVEGVGEALPLPDHRFDVVVACDSLEHVADLERVLDEVTRVLKPGGWFLFDTINKNPLASFVVVTMGEKVLRLLPEGTHDPALFIRPADLQRALTRRGYTVGRFQGFGPTGINRRLDPTFGLVPLTAVNYLGSAKKRG
ncbi:MAG: 3-demethylubiquinone-9 3-O-methyltransferase [Geminicoccaceae bacterium]|nr:MAG: 3-demethylubiquinone-9 3-O-methyltransferase [Geminicoccaceae bacterium]